MARIRANNLNRSRSKQKVSPGRKIKKQNLQMLHTDELMGYYKEVLYKG